MNPTPDDATLAVVVARLDDLREQQRRDTETLTEAIESLRRELATSRQDMVSRGEWIQRNAAVDLRFQEQGREIGGLRTGQAADVALLRAEHAEDMTAIRSRSAPWWSTWTVVLAAAAVAWSVLGPIITNR